MSKVLPGEPSKTRSVRVGWYARQAGISTRVDSVSLTEGYSTEDDIPRILSIYYRCDEDDVTILMVSSNEELA